MIMRYEDGMTGGSLERRCSRCLDLLPGFCRRCRGFGDSFDAVAGPLSPMSFSVY